MAANYKVNIELDTKKLDAQLKRLKKQVGEVGKVKRVGGGGGGKRGILANDADEQFIKNLGIKTRQFAKSINPILNKADKIASKGGMLALPSSEMRAAEKAAEIVAKQTERKAKAEQRSAEFAKEAMKANQASAKAGAAHAKKLERMRKDTGFTAAQYGPQFASSTLPTESALNFDRRTGKLLRGPAGSGGRSLRNLGRRFDTQSALISGAFPLLFGQGPITAAAGALGGGIGGMFGQMGGFAGGIAATALVGTVQQLADNARQLGEALRTTSGTMSLMTQRSLFSSEAVQAQALQLQKQGKQTELATLLTKELNDVLGVGSVDRLKDLGVKSKEMNRQFGILSTQLQLFISGPLTTFLAEINKILGRATMFSTIDTNLKQVREQLGEEAFNKRIREILKFTTFKEDFDSGILGPGPIGNVGGLGPGNILDPGINIAGVRNMDRLSEILKISSRGLTSSTVGGSVLDPMNTAKAEKSKLDSLVEQTMLYDSIIMFGKEEAEIRKQIKEFEEAATEQEQLQIATGKINVRQLIEQNNEAKKLADNAILVEESFKRLSETIATDIGNGIKDLIRGTSTLNDVMRNVLDKMIDAALNMAIFGNAGGSFSPGLGILGSIFRANGGPVKSGGSYIVGERGPELFTPGVSGMVTPNNALGGSTNVVVNVDASGSSVEGDEEQGKELGRLISVAVQSEIIQQQRPGGLLA